MLENTKDKRPKINESSNLFTMRKYIKEKKKKKK